MIVVAIIALVTMIAVPNFLRARKRTQATIIYDEMRMIEGAKDIWATENNKKTGDIVVWSDLRPHFKNGTSLNTRETSVDLLGLPIALNTVNSYPTISLLTYEQFKDALGGDQGAPKFWGVYKPQE